MGSLDDIAQEYLENVTVIEGRIAELKLELKGSSSQQELLALRRRINVLYQLAGEGRQLAFRMEHYYDKPKEESVLYVKTFSPAKQGDSAERRFRSSGYGAPAPAASMHGRNIKSAPVSGIRAQLSGGHVTAGDRGRA